MSDFCTPIMTAGERINLLHSQLVQAQIRIGELETQRMILAKLSADEPQFSNPIVAIEAKKLRDMVLEASK